MATDPDIKNPKPKVDLRELGVSGTKLLAGIIYEEKVPDLQGIRAYDTYHKMRLDATCAATLNAIELPLRSTRWYVEPATADPLHIQLADFVHDNLYNFGSMSMDDALRLALTMLAFGFSWMEVIYSVFTEGQWKGKVGWDRFAWRHQQTKWRWNVMEVDGKRELVSVTQLAPPYYEQVDIPRDKLLIFVYKQEGDNWDGISLLRSAYKHWFIKDNLYRVQAIGLERTYMGIPVVTLPAEFSDEERDLAKQIVTTVRTDEQAGIVHPEHLLVEVLFNKLEEKAMQQAIEHHDTKIPAAILADFLNLGQRGVGGSWALSTDKTSLFLDAINAIANYTAQVFNLRPGIPTLVNANFPNLTMADMPRLQHGDIGQRSLERLGRVLQALGQWGFLTPDDATEDKLREIIGLPQREYNFDNRDLQDLLQIAQPTIPANIMPGQTMPVRLRPGTMAPDPNDPRSQQMLRKIQQAQGGDQQQASNFYEDWEQIRLKNRWDRPKGRLDDITRRKLNTGLELAEVFSELQASAGSAPERPSVRMARLARPYRIRLAESREAELRNLRRKSALGGFRPTNHPPAQVAQHNPVRDVAARHQASLTRALIA